MAAHNGGGGLRHATAAAAPPMPSPQPVAVPRTLPPRLSSSAAALSSPPTSSVRSLDRDFITLAQPRPGVARARNEYIETPLRPPGPAMAMGQEGGKGGTLPLATTSGLKLEDLRGRTSPVAAVSSLTVPGSGSSGLPGGGGPSHHLLPSVHGGGGGGASHHLLHGGASSPYHHHHHHFQHRPLNQLQVPTVVKQQPTSGGGGVRTPTPSAIFKQPTSCGTSTAVFRKDKDASVTAKQQPTSCGATTVFRKEKDAAAAAAADLDTEVVGHEPAASIICRQCRKCRCDACRIPKALPSEWLCGNKCLCSADAILDTCSCMCCVKGCLYHTMKDYDMDNDVRCAERPCSCAPHRRCMRWGCMAALVPVVPCLLCYWPLKGCVWLCEAAYTEYHSQGCRCRDMPPQATRQSGKTTRGFEPLPSKRLLDVGSAVEC